MPRNSGSKPNALRERIAHLAARIMAEDGVDDFGYAKRKAARQAGALDARAMPDNEEVERALAEYRLIYQGDEHPAVLQSLREHALTVMEQMRHFNPHLSGSVLSGVAGKYSGIEILLFADTSKDVELFLLNHKWRYRASQVHCLVNQSERQIPTFILDDEVTEVQIRVFDREDVRHTIRSSLRGHPLQRAGLSDVRSLVESR